MSTNQIEQSCSSNEPTPLKSWRNFYPETIRKDCLFDLIEGDYTEKLNQDFEIVLDKLPVLIQTAVSANTAILPIEKIIIAYCALIIAGVIAPEVWVNYDNKRNYLTIYLIIILPPSSGKGMVGQVIKVLDKINDTISEEHNRCLAAYKVQYAIYKKAKKEDTYLDEPIKPSRNLILVPGNITSAKLTEMLANADGKQILFMCETEMDAFGVASRSDHGSQNSPILRSAFHHETISKAIKQDDQHLTIKTPKLSGIFAGTPNQVGKILHSNEDGLVSRFITINEHVPLTWKNTKPCEECLTLDDHFAQLGESYFQHWNYFRNKKIEVRFTDPQWDAIQEFGTYYMFKSHHFTGESSSSISKRHALLICRMAGIISMLRGFERQDDSSPLLCTDDDFGCALWLMEYSLKSSLRLFESLPGELSGKQVAKDKHTFFKQLPEAFTSDEIKPLLQELKIGYRKHFKWFEDFIEAGMIERVKQGSYIKLNYQ